MSPDHVSSNPFPIGIDGPFWTLVLPVLLFGIALIYGGTGATNLGQIALEVERVVGRNKVLRVGRADGQISDSCAFFGVP